jgi:hypothetical protein
VDLTLKKKEKRKKEGKRLKKALPSRDQAMQYSR